MPTFWSSYSNSLFSSYHRYSTNFSLFKKEETKKDEPIEMVFKLHMYSECQKCYGKLIKAIRGTPGVKSAKLKLNKFTVVGHLDPKELKSKVERIFNRSVELISPLEITQEKKELPVTTRTFAVATTGEISLKQINNALNEHEVTKVTLDKLKNQVTVTGAFDAKKLAEDLEEELKRPVEILPPENAKSKAKTSVEGKKEKKELDEESAEANVPEHGIPSGYKYPVHAPQLFSEENPTACSIL